MPNQFVKVLVPQAAAAPRGAQWAAAAVVWIAQALSPRPAKTLMPRAAKALS